MHKVGENLKWAVIKGTHKIGQDWTRSQLFYSFGTEVSEELSEPSVSLCVAISIKM